MGRKKKANKAKDSRGYSQGAPVSTSKGTASSKSAAAPSLHSGKLISKTKHSQIETLAKDPVSPVQLEDVAVQSDRFSSKLGNIVDTLDRLGFASDRIEAAVTALRYGVTLEQSLDWLCLNSDTKDLPTLFVDVKLKNEINAAPTAESLSVVKEKSTPNDGETHSDNFLRPNFTAKLTKEVGTRNADDEERKRWLLQQYQYEADGDEDSSASENPDAEKEDTKSLSPDEQLLLAEEARLSEFEADVNSDANNYMRSKGEIKELKIQLKKMKQQVSGLRRKVARAKAQQKRLEEMASSVAPQEESGPRGTFDVFGSSNNDKDDVTPTAKKSNVTAELLDYQIPQGWTGQTPQRTLDAVLRKSKWPRAKYGKLRGGGFNLSLTIDKKHCKWEARSSDFTKDSSLKDYLATQALYEVDPTVQMYQVLPRPFRELWLSWSTSKQQEINDAQQLVADTRKKRIERMIALIAESQSNTIMDEVGVKDRENESHDLAENMESIIYEEAKPLTRSKSSDGRRLQDRFMKLQATSAYQTMKAARDSLPMSAYREEILKTVQRNAVTVLIAETGAGKSTQCAQFILEQALREGEGDNVNIFCTQPRRVAATSLAQRVSDEMCDELGKLVGYSIRNESKKSAHTKLLFATTGVVLRRLQDDPSLSGLTHLIIDEVHERQQQIDLLLIIVRRLLQTTRPDLKVILMSATIETELFTNYFGGTPVISVPGRTYPVASYYLEDLLDATGHVIEEGSRYAFRDNGRVDTATLRVTNRGGEKRRETVDLVSSAAPLDVTNSYYDGYKMSTRRSMQRVNEDVINFDLIEDVLNLITSGQSDLVAPDGADMSVGSVLVFLPGLGEIKAMMERLEGSRTFRDRKRFLIVPMHSSLSSSDQRRAFLPAKPGCRKIILSTNIAETSVTIPDVVYVIDSGKMREVRRNKRTSSSMLVATWCPKSSAKQRSGRAGRVQPGVCLRLYSSYTAEHVMKVESEPELRRVPLEEVCMSVLASNFAAGKGCLGFLSEAPQPPSPESVMAALNNLEAIGAIEVSESGTTERLTTLGKHLAKLPLDVKLGKMLIFAALFSCIEPIVTIAAMLSSKSPFSNYFNDSAAAQRKQRAFEDPVSDFMTFCNVWEKYSAAAEVSSSNGLKFCKENFLNHVSLREIADARRQYLDLLCSAGFLDRGSIYSGGRMMTDKERKSSHFNKHAGKREIVHSVICAGLYPNVADLQQGANLDVTIHDKTGSIYLHSSSTNARKKRFQSSERWLIFHEKFSTPHRTSVSATAFAHPFALVLFGGTVVVKHTERLVVVDDWINLDMAAQTGVMMREIRAKVDRTLQKKIEGSTDEADTDLLERIIQILDG
mmetsp:Transcript_12968/g.29836  ORF Transcript_12968/g.29836 Transcript_12968/m.29836 type:complete len:1347 (+) Transcript_12968:199-4239(+)